MTKIKNYVDNQFFIIDSEKLSAVYSKMYGFSISEGNIISDDNIEDDIKLNGDGVYVRILREGNNIQISQDFNGSFGIYIYNNDADGSFVISNSFLKLVDYVKDKYHISLNKDVALSFIPADLCNLSYKKTLINEIEVIPRNYIININISIQTYSFEKIYYNEDTVSIDSVKGIKILDDWFFKWINIIRLLKEKTNNLKFELSGGFDSRIILTLLLNANINLNKVHIYTINNQTLKEDYEIASILAKKYDFKLNQEFYKNVLYIDDFHDAVNMLNYIKLGFHKESNFPDKFFTNPIYIFGGFGGESLRDYWNFSPQEYLENSINRAKRFSPEFIEPTRNVILNSLKELQEEFNVENDKSKKLTELLYREIRNRNHFGKISALSFLTNELRLSPLLDQNLHKLNKSEFDRDLLFALIFTRYCPELLDIKFDSGKKIDKNLIEFAQKINKRYPFANKKLTYVDGPNECIKIDSQYDIHLEKNAYIEEYLKKVFLSHSFKSTFEMYFSYNFYQFILNEVKNRRYPPLSLVNSSMAVLKMIDSVNFNKEKFSNNSSDWFDNFLDIDSFNGNHLDGKIVNEIMKFNTARIDIKNIGIESNTLDEINCSDKFIKIMNPPWFSDDTGIGHVFETTSNKLHISFRCINDGKLKISLRSKDTRDKNRKFFPIYLDFTKFLVNEVEILKSNELVWCNSPYVYIKEVKNNERIDLEVEWLPFNSESIYKF